MIKSSSLLISVILITAACSNTAQSQMPEVSGERIRAHADNRSAMDPTLLARIVASAPPAPPRRIARVREYFPETMFVRPELIADERGVAELTVPIADSITAWRVSAFASSASGRIGSAQAPLKVFQDFFVDIGFRLCGWATRYQRFALSGVATLAQNRDASFPVKKKSRGRIF